MKRIHIPLAGALALGSFAAQPWASPADDFYGHQESHHERAGFSAQFQTRF